MEGALFLTMLQPKIPADVNITGKCSGLSTSLVFCNDIAYTRHNSGVQYFPATKTNFKVSSLMKDELIAEFKNRNLEGGAFQGPDIMTWRSTKAQRLRRTRYEANALRESLLEVFIAKLNLKRVTK